MQHLTFKAKYAQTLSWLKDEIVDWSQGGTVFSLNGETSQINQYHYAFSFDSAINTEDGQYVFIYKRLGTKGLLIKNGEVLREINRSYYQAEVYEYPAAFLTLGNGRVVLVHCPSEYCRIDFEDVETGEILTNHPERKPKDCFHSRLEISLDSKFLLSKGWYWHPWDGIELFDIEACLENPLLLDKGKIIPNCCTEICSASFIDNDSILVCSSDEESMDDENEEPIPPNHLAIWYFKKDEISKAVKIQGKFGNLIAIDEDYCWDLYNYPKIINIKTGIIEDKIEEHSTGLQQSSIIHHLEGELSVIAYSRIQKKLAFKNGDDIEVVWR
jgi:hypothetical protein